MGRVCKKCSNDMHLARVLRSGNATFETWQCDHCEHREEFCTGLTEKK